MIVDNILHAPIYYCLGDLFKAALEFFSRNDLNGLPEGKLFLQDDQLIAIVATYEKKLLEEFILLEGHRRYADIQYVVSGSEILAWKSAPLFSEKGPYNSENDVWNCTLPKGQLNFARLSGGEFAILFPWDAHAPQLQDGVPGRVKKIVLKVALHQPVDI